MSDPPIPSWLESLPLAPEFHPTETDFSDPITFISRIESLAAPYGICKIIPPLPKPSKRFTLTNLNRSISKSDHSPAVFTTRHQELGSRRKPVPPPVHKQVWQSGESYTLEQFEVKSRAFARSQLSAYKDVSPLLIEALFWKMAKEKPIYIEYANDVPGSGFGARGRGQGTGSERLSNSHWNLQAIARAPGSVTRFMPDDVQGVTSPMVYIGMLFSWFAWHVEDHDLHSMNYLHTGAAKTWYAVPAEYASTLEEIVRVQGYGSSVDRLEAFSMLGEKTTLLSPEILKASGVPCCRLVQHAGEYVVTFPRAYHVGFSHGFNCGEAANFATPHWLNVAKEAAVRRAAMNYLPMLSHQHLLYLLTMSFISRIPRELLSDVRSSRLRDRKKEERETMVKRAFLKDMKNENHLLCSLLAKDSAPYVVLWEPELLPSPCSGSLSFSSSGVLEGHGFVAEKNRREMVNSSPTYEVPFHCKSGTIDVESELDEETANTNSVPCNSTSPAGMQKPVCDIENTSFDAKKLHDIDDDGDDLPHGLNVNSGSLTCLACGVLGYPFMAILQPSERAWKEIFPPNSEEFHQNSAKSGHLNLSYSVPCIGRKLNSDYSKDSSCALYPNSGGHAPSTEASKIGSGFSLLDDDFKESSSDCGTGLVMIGGRVNKTTAGHLAESSSDEQQCCIRSTDLKKSMSCLVTAKSDPNSMKFFGLCSLDETNCSVVGPEEGSEYQTKNNWRISNKFMRPRIFCLQHALEIQEILHPKGGGNMLIICHSDYNKINAHAISVAEDIGIKFNLKDVPLGNASSEDLNLINTAIDEHEDHEDHEEYEDWTSVLGLNLRYCVKLRKRSSAKPEKLPLALRGIFSDHSPTIVSNLKWHSRKSRTPYKVIGTVELKPEINEKIEKDESVMKSSTADSLKEMKVYHSRKHVRVDMVENHNCHPTEGTLEELSNGKNIGQLNHRSVNVLKSGDANILHEELENINFDGPPSVPVLSGESTQLHGDILQDAKVIGSDDMNLKESVRSTPLANSHDEACIRPNNLHRKAAVSVPVLSGESSQLHGDILQDAKVSGSDDMNLKESVRSTPLAKSHDEACIRPNNLHRKAAVSDHVISQHPSSEILHDLHIADKRNTKVCYPETVGHPADIMATEDGRGHSARRIIADNSSSHMVNGTIYSVDSCTGRTVDDSEVLCEVTAPREPDFEGSLCNSVFFDYQSSTSLPSTSNSGLQVQVLVSEETETDATGSLVTDFDTRPEVSVLRENDMEVDRGSDNDKFEMYQGLHAASDVNDTGSSDMRQVLCIVREMQGNGRFTGRRIQSSSASDLEESGYANSFIVQQEVLSASETEENRKTVVSVSSSCHPVAGLTVDSFETCPQGLFFQNVDSDVAVDNSLKLSPVVPVESNGMPDLVGDKRYADANGDDHCTANSTEMYRSVVVYRTYVRRNKRKRESENSTGGGTTVPSPCEVLTYARKNKRKKEHVNTTVGGTLDCPPCELLTYVRRNKRKVQTNNTVGGGTFVRGPCEGLRRRSEQNERGRNEATTLNKDKAMRVTKRTDGSVGQRGKHGRNVVKAVNKDITVKVTKRTDGSVGQQGKHKVYRCTYKGCDKRFISRASSIYHQRVHNNERPFKCSWEGCNMSFKWKWSRVEHIRTHTGERPYKCEVSGCGMTFRYTSSFSAHRRKYEHSLQ